MVNVIYLSLYQGEGHKINGPLLAQNVSAIMVRGGQGIWVDPQFWYNYQICIDNKIPFGIWWFFQVNMKAQPQIDCFMKLWNSLPVKPKVIALDVEEINYIENGVRKVLFPPSRQFNHENVLQWCKAIKILTGAQVGIYTRKNYFEDWTIETNEWYDFWLWIAAWYVYIGTNPPGLPWYWSGYKIHQYQGGGPGTPGVDPIHTCKEYFNGTEEECDSFFGMFSEPIDDPEKKYLEEQLAAWEAWYVLAPKD